MNQANMLPFRIKQFLFILTTALVLQNAKANINPCPENRADVGLDNVNDIATATNSEVADYSYKKVNIIGSKGLTVVGENDKNTSVYFEETHQKFILGSNCTAVFTVNESRRVVANIQSGQCKSLSSEGRHNCSAGDKNCVETIISFVDGNTKKKGDEVQIIPIGTKYSVDLYDEMIDEAKAGTAGQSEKENRIKVGDKIHVEKGSIAIRLKKVKPSKKVAKSSAQDSEDYEEKLIYLNEKGTAKIKKNKKNKERVGDIEVVYPDY